jgi:hypothetical protein
VLLPGCRLSTHSAFIAESPPARRSIAAEAAATRNNPRSGCSDFDSRRQGRDLAGLQVVRCRCHIDFPGQAGVINVPYATSTQAGVSYAQARHVAIDECMAYQHSEITTVPLAMNSAFASFQIFHGPRPAAHPLTVYGLLVN